MEELVFSDTESLCQSIRQLYTLRNPDTFGMDALSIVNQLVPSEIPTFHFVCTQKLKISISYLPDFPGLPAALESQMNRGFGEHPICQNMPQTLNAAYQLSDFVSHKELYSLEGLYQNFLSTGQKIAKGDQERVS